MHLHGRRALVTGASRGIGAALARQLARRGAQLALVARASTALDGVATELGGVAYPCDLTDLTAVDDLVERVEADGGVDVLINNAGVSNVGWFLDRTLPEIDQVITLNLTAPLHLCRLLLPRMIARGRGHVVNISSMAGVIAPPGLVAYGASKAGLSHMTAGLRADLRDQPVTLTNVHLGSVATDMDDAARSYGPLRQLAERSSGRDITPMDDFVAAVVRAIEHDREEVRVPRAMAPLAAATNLPRRIGRLVFARAMVAEPRPDPPPSPSP
jgi:short-subunit dehydrogenase